MICDVVATEDVAAAVHRLADGSAGLLHIVTPGGEVDRPVANLYRPTFVAALPRRLLVEFEDQILLIVTQPTVVAASAEGLRLSFSQLTLDWLEFGSLRPHVSNWTLGHFELRAQSGV